MKAKVFTFKASYSSHYFKLFSLFLWVTVVRELPLLHGDMSSITDDDGNSTLWSNLSPQIQNHGQLAVAQRLFFGSIARKSIAEDLSL